MTAPPKSRVLAFATQGAGGDDEQRLRRLACNLDASFFEFRHGERLNSCIGLLSLMSRRQHAVALMEGTGIAGGAAVILGKLLFGLPYVVSSGDAVAPFLSARFPLGEPFFRIYEHFLYRCCAGFIGWTPYLVGRALTFGAPRAMTAPGWAPFQLHSDVAFRRGMAIRSELGIPADAVVFGIAGSLAWSARYSYCYGAELVRAVLRSGREALCILIVGDGEGLERLKALAGNEAGKRIFFPGRVPRDQIPGYLAAMDIGSLPQSVDQVGSFRYTTKVSEYIATGLPFVTGQIPAGYDLGPGCLWRLRGSAPWDESFISDLTRLMDSVTPGEIAAKRIAAHKLIGRFDERTQVEGVTAFLQDVIEDQKRIESFR